MYAALEELLVVTLNKFGYKRTVRIISQFIQLKEEKEEINLSYLKEEMISFINGKTGILPPS